jgi:hypothetical protein
MSNKNHSRKREECSMLTKLEIKITKWKRIQVKNRASKVCFKDVRKKHLGLRWLLMSNLRKKRKSLKVTPKPLKEKKNSIIKRFSLTKKNQFLLL